PPGHGGHGGFTEASEFSVHLRVLCGREKKCIAGFQPAKVVLTQKELSRLRCRRDAGATIFSHDLCLRGEQGAWILLELGFPQIVSVFPMGAEPGTLTDVEVRGEFLDGALRVVFSDTAFSARVQRSSFTRVELQIQVPARADPGPRYFRLITPRGASNLLLFRVSRWA